MQPHHAEQVRRESLVRLATCVPSLTSTPLCPIVATCRQQSARKNALQVIAEYEGTPAGAVEVPDLSALRELYSEKNPAVPSLRYPSLCY